MKTNEFIKEVEALGFFTGTLLKTGISVRTKHGEGILMIGSQSVYKINTFYDAYENLEICTREKLFKLALEYASTPINEREEEKKYYIVMQKIKSSHDHLNFNKRDKYIILSTRSETLEYQTQFTKSEIKKYGLEIFTENPLFELVEVKNEY